MTSPSPGVDPRDPADTVRPSPADHPTSLDSRWLQRRRRHVRAGRGADAVPDRSDVVVVGAGIAGLLTAWQLRQTGRSVAVVEAGAVAGRTTGHSTAKVSALHGTIYQRLAAAKGGDAASAYATAQQWAVVALRDLVGSLQLECGFTEAVSYSCATTPDGVAVVEDEVRAAAAAGLPVSLVRGTELDEVFDLDVTACGLGGQAHLDPVAFCDGLAAALRERGTEVIEHVRVHDATEDERGCEVTLHDGRVVHADQVVLATHIPTIDPALLAGRSAPSGRTW
ncbi:MAG: FAD-binding oxidoreductase [Ilumatobacteraceae bacterium]